MSVNRQLTSDSLNIRCPKDSYDNYLLHKNCPHFTPNPSPSDPRFAPLCRYFHKVNWTHHYGFCANPSADMDASPLPIPKQHPAVPRRLMINLVSHIPGISQTRQDALEVIAERNGRNGRKPDRPPEDEE